MPPSTPRMLLPPMTDAMHWTLVSEGFPPHMADALLWYTASAEPGALQHEPHAVMGTYNEKMRMFQANMGGEDDEFIFVSAWMIPREPK